MGWTNAIKAKTDKNYLCSIRHRTLSCLRSQVTCRSLMCHRSDCLPLIPDCFHLFPITPMCLNSLRLPMSCVSLSCLSSQRTYASPCHSGFLLFIILLLCHSCLPRKSDFVFILCRSCLPRKSDFCLHFYIN